MKTTAGSDGDGVSGALVATIRDNSTTWGTFAATLRGIEAVSSAQAETANSGAASESTDQQLRLHAVGISNKNGDRTWSGGGRRSRG